MAAAMELQRHAMPTESSLAYMDRTASLSFVFFIALLMYFCRTGAALSQKLAATVLTTAEERIFLDGSFWYDKTQRRRARLLR
jgi:hypothetical protein